MKMESCALLRRRNMGMRRRRSTDIKGRGLGVSNNTIDFERLVCKLLGAFGVHSILHM